MNKTLFLTVLLLLGLGLSACAENQNISEPVYPEQQLTPPDSSLPEGPPDQSSLGGSEASCI